MSNYEERFNPTVNKPVDDRSRRINNLFATTDGKRVLADLEAQCYDCQLFESDPYKTAFLLGQREVVRFIKETMRMVREYE